MQRMVFLAVLMMLTLLGGCAGRDPNLTVRNLGEFGHVAGQYTLKVNVYDLDQDGRPRLAASEADGLRSSVRRTLAAKGYTMMAAAPARYDIEVHLLCGNMRTADMGLMSEALQVPADAAGSGYSSQVHYWLPVVGQGSGAQDPRQGRAANDRPGVNTQGGAPLGHQPPDFCQGRVLVAVSTAASGAQRDVFVGRAATGDCRAVSGCPVGVCRPALEQSLQELLERRF